MNKQEVIDGLKSFKERLTGEVVNAYAQRGSSFGNDRFNTWRRKFTNFLNEHLPQGNRIKISVKPKKYVRSI